VNQEWEQASLAEIGTSSRLSAREMQYLLLYGEGLDNEAIAARLGIEPQSAQQLEYRIRHKFRRHHRQWLETAEINAELDERREREARDGGTLTAGPDCRTDGSSGVD
jgi:DNA-binding CsgD family transcriptional regulator